jgi:hypothetical protein
MHLMILALDFLPRFNDTDETEHRGRHGCRRWRSSSTHYGARGKTKLLPMRSRRARGLILLTFGEANNPRRASGGCLKSLVFDHGV